MPEAASVRSLLETHLQDLTAQQRRAADFLLLHHRTAFSMSVQELGRAADVSEATLVRLARRLGFRGYLDMRAALTNEAKRDLLPEDRFAFEEPSVEPAGTAVKVARQEVENINRTVELIEPKQLERFVGHLRRAELVATVGLGVSAILARLASYLFFQVGVRSEVLLRDVLTLVEQVEHLPKGAVLLAFGFRPYSKHTVAAAERAVERRIPVLAITDDAGSPLGRLAKATLVARTDNVLYTNSVSGVTVVLNALATELALGNKKGALGRLRATSRGLEDEYL